MDINKKIKQLLNEQNLSFNMISSKLNCTVAEVIKAAEELLNENN